MLHEQDKPHVLLIAGPRLTVDSGSGVLSADLRGLLRILRLIIFAFVLAISACVSACCHAAFW